MAIFASRLEKFHGRDFECPCKRRTKSTTSGDYGTIEQFVEELYPMARSRLTFALLTAIAVAMHAPILELRLWDSVIYVACLIVALTFGLRWATHMALLGGLIALMALVPALDGSVGRMPVLPLLLPLLLSSLAVAAWPDTRRTLRWLRLGHVDAKSRVLVGVTGLASAGALVTWAAWTDNLGIGERMLADLGSVPVIFLLLLGIPLFALLNAITEEAIFRGVMLTAMLESSRSTWLANILQASAFAAIHFEMGFPNGPVGYAMVLVYGLMLGYLRLRTGGLLAPLAAHVVADLVIGLILFGQVRYGYLPAVNA